MTAMMALFVLAAIAIMNATAISATEQTGQLILKTMQAGTPANVTPEGKVRNETLEWFCGEFQH